MCHFFMVRVSGDKGEKMLFLDIPKVRTYEYEIQQYRQRKYGRKKERNKEGEKGCSMKRNKERYIRKRARWFSKPKLDTVHG